MSRSAGTGWQWPVFPGASACARGGVRVGDAVLGALLSLSPSWGWGGGWEQARSSEASPPSCLGLPRGSWPWDASGGLRAQQPSPCPGHVPGVRGASRPGDWVCMYLFASVSCVPRGAAALSPRYGSEVLAALLPLVPLRAEPPAARAARSGVTGGGGGRREHGADGASRYPAAGEGGSWGSVVLGDGVQWRGGSSGQTDTAAHPQLIWGVDG